MHFRKWCTDVMLLKGFRYETIVYHYGNGLAPDFFKLGVKFPDNTEVKPITNTYLRRSIGEHWCISRFIKISGFHGMFC